MWQMQRTKLGIVFIPDARRSSSLLFNIILHTWDPPFHWARVGICFLQYLFYIKFVHRGLLVLNLHHNFAYIAFEISNKDLKLKPPSCCGKHIFSQAAQCLVLPLSLLLQKIAKFLYSSLIAHLGGTIVDNIWMGMLCKTLVIKDAFLHRITSSPSW